MEMIIWKRNFIGLLFRLFYEKNDIEIHHIPDSEYLLLRIHKEHYKNGVLDLIAFLNSKQNYVLSNDIALFSSVEKIRKSGPQDSNKYHVGKIKASVYYNLSAKIYHLIECGNYAHCNVEFNPNQEKWSKITRREMFEQLKMNTEIIE